MRSDPSRSLFDQDISDCLGIADAESTTFLQLFYSGKPFGHLPSRPAVTLNEF